MKKHVVKVEGYTVLLDREGWEEWVAFDLPAGTRLAGGEPPPFPCIAIYEEGEGASVEIYFTARNVRDMHTALALAPVKATIHTPHADAL